MALQNGNESDRARRGTGRHMPGWVVVASVPLVAAIVAIGVWLAGSITDDATRAMLLTTAWFVLAGTLVLFVAWRWRSLAVAVVATYVVVAAAIGGFLLYTSTVDQVVDEDVVMAVAPTGDAADDQAGGGSGARAAPVSLASGAFVAAAHETSGRAELVGLPDGSRVLTLTDFDTDPGPDLRVLLAPGDGMDVSDARDLGALKGNRGDQQYDVPADAPDGSVVIWCRAFTVAFGSATLT